jgi:hypothetical protein
VPSFLKRRLGRLADTHRPDKAVGYVDLRIEDTLNAAGAELIPDYIIRYRETDRIWFANLLQGLFATIRICIYAGSGGDLWLSLTRRGALRR